MKVPRDINASELIKLLERHGYTVIRQTGSHIRLSKTLNGKEHAITIPNHKPIKIGTQHSIVKDVCNFNSYNMNGFYSQL
jgi:predicted RNA binding protein YcfA (HicA-like mRNA interferase family)